MLSAAEASQERTAKRSSDCKWLTLLSSNGQCLCESPLKVANACRGSESGIEEGFATSSAGKPSKPCMCSGVVFRLEFRTPSAASAEAVLPDTQSKLPCSWAGSDGGLGTCFQVAACQEANAFLESTHVRSYSSRGLGIRWWTKARQASRTRRPWGPSSEKQSRWLVTASSTEIEGDCPGRTAQYGRTSEAVRCWLSCNDLAVYVLKRGPEPVRLLKERLDPILDGGLKFQRGAQLSRNNICKLQQELCGEAKHDGASAGISHCAVQSGTTAQGMA